MKVHQKILIAALLVTLLAVVAMLGVIQVLLDTGRPAF